jgi:hypothetical protein
MKNFKDNHKKKSKKFLNKFWSENERILYRNYSFYTDNITFINNLYTNTKLFITPGLSLSTNTEWYSTDWGYIDRCETVNHKLLVELNRQKDEFNTVSLEKKN